MRTIAGRVLSVSAAFLVLVFLVGMKISYDSPTKTFSLTVTQDELNAAMTPPVSAGPALLVERVGGPHATLPAPSGPVPAKGTGVLDPTTGISITRLTNIDDVVATPGVNCGLPWASSADIHGLKNHGFYNGYSRWSNVNVTGEYMIAFRSTNNHSSLYKTDGTYLGPFVPDANHAIGESCEPRWDRSGRPGTATRIYHHFNDIFCQQDVLAGYGSKQVIYDFSKIGIMSTGDMDCSDDARYWALKLHDPSGVPKCVVLDAVSKVVLPGFIMQDTSGLDISPSGKWFVVDASSSVAAHQFRFYRISDMATGDMTKPVWLTGVGNMDTIGHNGWAYDKAGNEVVVYQDNATDWFCYFNPETQQTVKLISLTETGINMNNHTARMPKSKPGWQLFSTYSGLANWSYNQLFMIELVPPPAVPRILRICNNAHAYQAGQYFTEAFASIDPAGQNVYWGGNWNGTTPLEIYRATLPTGWNTILEAAK